MSPISPLAAQLQAATDEFTRNQITWSLVALAQKGSAEERARAMSALVLYYKARLVEPMASGFASRETMRWDDFVQQGVLGLIDAVDSAEVRTGDSSFEAYAKWFVHHEMVGFRGGETTMESSYQERNWTPVREARDRFYAREGRQPSIDEVVEEVNRDRGPNDRIGPRTVKAVLRAENPWVPILEDRPTDTDAPSGYIPTVGLDGATQDTDGLGVDEPFRHNPSVLAGRFELIRGVLGEEKGASYIVTAVLLSVTDEVNTYESLREHLVEEAPRFAGRPLGFDQELVTWSMCHAKLALPEWVPSRWSAVGPLFRTGSGRVIGAPALGARYRTAEKRLVGFGL